MSDTTTIARILRRNIECNPGRGKSMLNTWLDLSRHTSMAC